jgi:hypothetical protein
MNGSTLMPKRQHILAIMAQNSEVDEGVFGAQLTSLRNIPHRSNKAELQTIG